jgi:hypothetical protein
LPVRNSIFSQHPDILGHQDQLRFPPRQKQRLDPLDKSDTADGQALRLLQSAIGFACQELEFGFCDVPLDIRDRQSPSDAAVVIERGEVSSAEIPLRFR